MAQTKAQMQVQFDSTLAAKDEELNTLAQSLESMKSELDKYTGTHGVIAQLRDAFRSENRLAAFTGLLLGGIVPLATWCLAHYEVKGDGLVDVFTGGFTPYLVIGGLVYSAKTVWQWGKLAFGCHWKATGFVLLLEGVLTMSHTSWLNIAALVYLMGINAIATASILAKRG